MIELGDEVKDRIGGFKGVAVCRHTYINGCVRISVQQKYKSGSAELIEFTFDEPQLELMKRGSYKPAAIAAKTGGPERHMPSAKSTGAM